MALNCLAHFKFFLQTGTLPIASKLGSELLNWFNFLLPIFGMVLLDCFAWLLIPLAYVVAPFLMKEVNEGRSLKRRRLKLVRCNKVPLPTIDARRMSVSHYMVAPSWSYIFTRSARWWNSYFNALKVVYRYIYIPMRWSSKWAILWPPPGILTTILTLFFILIVHTIIFLRLFGLCCKHSFKN